MFHDLGLRPSEALGQGAEGDVVERIFRRPSPFCCTQAELVRGDLVDFGFFRICQLQVTMPLLEGFRLRCGCKGQLQSMGDSS